MTHGPQDNTILLTGFEPYGGRDFNPTADIVVALSGTRVADFAVDGQLLPVAYQPLRTRIVEAIATSKPRLVVSLGLWPGTPVVRIERTALNVADFEIPDNDGNVLRDHIISRHSGTALMSTLPLRDIEKTLLDSGIPAQVTNTAGTFLCNAALFEFLNAVSDQTPCGFLHMPYAAHQVARLVAHEKSAYTGRRSTELASMDIDTMIKAVQLAIEVSIASLAESVVSN